MPNIELFESMLFNYETTNRTDFQEISLISEPRTVYKEIPTRTERSLPTLKDTNTLTVWKNPDVPFGLFTQPKDIVRSDFETIQTKCMTPEAELEASAEDRNNIQATRPRLVMSPALSMDDIDNPMGELVQRRKVTRQQGFMNIDTTIFSRKLERAREILIKDIYKSTVQKMQEVCVGKESRYRASLDGRLTAAVPITLPKVAVPVVSPEWRLESVAWDRRTVRGFADPTKEFWLRRVPMCHACDVTAAIEAQKKAMRRQQ